MANPTSSDDDDDSGKSLVDKLQFTVVTSSITLCMLLLVGHLLRARFIWLRALHLPASVVGAIAGWLFFAFLELVGTDSFSDDWLTPGWDVMPGFCTNIVFACLFLGTPVPRLGAILESPRREHLIYGLVVVFGQYVVSAFCTGNARTMGTSAATS